MLGAWALMEFKTGGLDQKICNATHVADETQLCTTECTVDTLESARIYRTGKSDQKSVTKVLHSWFLDDQQPRREDSSGFLTEFEQKVDGRIASRFSEIAKLLLENRSLRRKERWSRLEASGQQPWQDYRSYGSYSGRRGGHLLKHQRKKCFMYRCTIL